MIIKSLGRKTAGRLGGSLGRSLGPIRALTRYMNRGILEEDGQAVLWQNFYGSDKTDENELVEVFEGNARSLRSRRNGNVLYHEILAFSEGAMLKGDALMRSIADVGQEYLRLRAPDQLAYGVVHKDTDHIHLHLMISANAVGKSDRVRLAKAEFTRITREAESFVLDRYPELAQTRVIGKIRDPERAKGNVHEQAQKVRTGKLSRKDAIKGRLHGLLEQAQNQADLETLFARDGFRLYTRGKSTGVIVREPDGIERKHRFGTLGLEKHYEMTLDRFAGRVQTPRPSASESTVTEPLKEKPIKSPKPPEKVMPEYFESDKPVLGLDEAKELLTGKLSPRNHGPIKDEPKTDIEKLEARRLELEATRKRRKERELDNDQER
jgi:Relaxase/Mobilisation nuclease domain